MTAKTTTAATDRFPHTLPGVQIVTVNGQEVGAVCRNKYGVWIGTFDRDALAPGVGNPFVASVPENTVEPGQGSRGNGRTKRDVVADVVARRGRFANRREAEAV